jgi:hypothetical protein
MEYCKLNIGDLVQIVDNSYYSVKTELGIYTITEEHVGKTYISYIGVLMFGDKQYKAWIFPSQENKAWIKVSSVN